MRSNILYSIAFLALIICALVSCSKQDLDEIEIGVDPYWNRHTVTWKETERKSGSSDWMSLSNGNSLQLWWDYPDSLKRLL